MFRRKIFTLSTAIIISFMRLNGESLSAPIAEELANEAQTNAKDSHFLFDVQFKNDYITPRGLLVTNSDLTAQITLLFELNLYKSSCDFINDVTINGGIWNDIWTGQNNPYVGVWNEMDWFAGFDIAFLKNWKFRTEFIQLLSPPHNFKPENNLEFTLYYDDTAKYIYPISFHPYLRVWYAISGDSNVITGRRGNTYYVELGLVPTYTWENCYTTVTFTAPTWLSFGPASYWNGGKLALKNENSHFGLFSTGLNAKIPLTFISKKSHKWYGDVGVQYYGLINKNLVHAQKYTVGGKKRRNICVATVGFGFEF